MNTILATGATGNVGRAVVAELRAYGADMQAFVRDERRARDVLGADVPLAMGDFTDAVSFAWPLRTLTYLVSNSHHSSRPMWSCACSPGSHARLPLPRSRSRLLALLREYVLFVLFLEQQRE